METTGLPVIVLPIKSLLFLELIKKTLTSDGTLQFSRQTSFKGNRNSV